MSCDKLVFDLSQEVEGSPSVFVKKDWVSILDNQNGSYNSNQSVIDTSQLSNSNKYMSYREAYLMMPMLLTIAETGTPSDTSFIAGAAAGCDYAFGLKNWFGTMIHSFTLDYNGTTIIQQTPFINMWNSFKLMTTLSWADVTTIGSTIGFYPDDPLTWGYSTAVSSSGMKVANNSTSGATAGVCQTASSNTLNNYSSGGGNIGLTKRIQYINFDLAGIPSASAGAGTYQSLLISTAPANLWKSYVSLKRSSLTAGLVPGILQITINATIYLKHIHSFFQQCPLLKGVFMKMTMNLNNASGSVTKSGTAAGTLTLNSVTIPVGGVCPFMISSTAANSGGTVSGAGGSTVGIDLSVGKSCLSSVSSVSGVGQGTNNSINLYVPAYTFNPTFERAYLSSPVKSIKYTDVYQYQTSTTGNTQFNALITNGIAGIKSVLILPFHKASAVGGVASLRPFESPFDPAGAGPTSPLCLITNFNVVVSGQNMLYNTQRYGFEQFNNQLLGINSVNGGLTDGLTSGLISSLGFEMEYCYYYVDVSRMLPVEETVPKSVQIIGQSQSALDLDLFVFIEYGCSVDIDILTGARV
jgi:hypothetical protein